MFSCGFETFENSEIIDEVIITNSIDHSNLKHFSKIKILSLAQFLGLVIKANVENTSITEIYHAYSK
ncbi:hypothetical protein [Mycoplasma struthionis]|uniref:hypothetical protein n=1 Tax=Mycoplasma struthionis TaxID=538220 RepID=UPI003A5C7F39